ncbi:MAG: glycosyltransferase [Calditrichaeota bacterium]|nr:glycosyltransferase [Calditrichota bacterium]
MWEYLFLGLSLFYAGLIMFFFSGILRERGRREPPSGWQPLVTVVVPARDEAAGIHRTLESLARQTYPATHLEVIFVDDDSRDATPAIIRDFIDTRRLAHFQLRTHHNDTLKRTYKKSAVAFGIRHSSGEVILTTDADCSVPPDWVASMVRCYAPDTGLVAGLITFDPAAERNLFHRLQTLEFAGLVFAGVGAIGNRYPLICNGSNLSYRRAAFEEVGGFGGHEHVPSGDDDLFMQNIHHHTEWKIRYNLDRAAINLTTPMDTLGQFLNQRARWASKSTEYPGLLTFLLLFLLYLFYLMLLILTPVTLLGYFSWKFLLAGFMLKLIPELLVIYQALSVLGRRKLLRLLVWAEAVQIPYIVLAGFAGFFNFFRWKQK